MSALAFPVALALIGAWDGLIADGPRVLPATALFAAAAAICFRASGMYRGVWRYASIRDLVAIVAASAAAIAFFSPIMALAQPANTLPWRMLPVLGLLMVAMLAGPRLIYRAFKDSRSHRVAPNGAPRDCVLLVGAGDAAERFIRATEDDPKGTFRVVGLLDEKERRVGRMIRGVPVLGGLDAAPAVIEALAADGRKPTRLILTKGRERIDGGEIRDLMAAIEPTGATLARLPADFASAARVSKALMTPQPVALADLLGRPQAQFDRAAVERLLASRRVLVTGAGGTIGQELCRQIAALGPARMILVEHSEFNLYAIELDLAERFPGLALTPVLADVRDREQMIRLFGAEAPQVVFHAAALKHVPIVEDNPCQGVLTNAVGSRNVADAARRAGAEAMVLISTDKAVNPSSVMGATKRLAEGYCQASDVLAPPAGGETGPAGPRTRFMTVRFGNVLGSTGSVVPLFERQIARGGPLTVTHPDVERYFMTVGEAVELVLHASAYGMRSDAQRGRILVLDMGRPIRIVDLARQMIRLAGLEPDRDVPIRFTGLRAGEKLTEELFAPAEPLSASPVDGVLIAAPRPADHAILSRALGELAEAARRDDGARVLALLHHLVPEFRTEGVALPATDTGGRDDRAGRTTDDGADPFSVS